ncbi:MAG: phosphoribosylformylglycinamidine synthase subunit PurS [Promethearchaeota archaeon]
MESNQFIVEIVLENKKRARDPVGETIQKDLLVKKGYEMVSNVRSGQYLRITLRAKDENSAADIVTEMANKLRIFNPVTQDLKILKISKQDS